MSAGRSLGSPLAGAIFSVAVALASVSSVGCAHESESELMDPFTQTRQLESQELEELLWPRTDERWDSMGAHELLALEDLVGLLWRRAEGGQLRGDERHRAGALAALAGVEVESVEVVLGGDAGGEGEEPVSLWVVYEGGEERRGTGAYLIRRGELDARRVELLVETPHVFHDRHTGLVGLALLLGERDPSAGVPGMARGLFVNTVHRDRKADGSKARPEEGYGPADAAHSEYHPLSRVNARIVKRHHVALLQLHGFERSAQAGDPAMIVSSGRKRPSPESQRLSKGLATAFPLEAIGNFGTDSDRLGGTTNVQGRAAREAKRCFVHVEIGDALRETLREAGPPRASFAKAVLAWLEGIQSGGCR